jgi:hypothetical protein
MAEVKRKHYKKPISEEKKAPAVFLTEKKTPTNPILGFQSHFAAKKNKPLEVEKQIKAHKSEEAVSDDGNKNERKASMVSSTAIKVKENEVGLNFSDED